MRGKEERDSYDTYKARITPACAGKSAAGDAKLWVLEDHPRVCGEKFSMILSIALLLGSPPRVRGKAEEILVETAGLRITPACAGKRKGFTLQENRA